MKISQRFEPVILNTTHSIYIITYSSWCFFCFVKMMTGVRSSPPPGRPPRGDSNSSGGSTGMNKPPFTRSNSTSAVYGPPTKDPTLGHNGYDAIRFHQPVHMLSLRVVPGTRSPWSFIKLFQMYKWNQFELTLYINCRYASSWSSSASTDGPEFTSFTIHGSTSCNRSPRRTGSWPSSQATKTKVFYSLNIDIKIPSNWIL